MKLQHFLLTAFLLFTGVDGVYATKRYVGFTGSVPSPNYPNSQLQDALTDADDGNDTVFVAAGLYVAYNAEFTVPEGVTLIGGYEKNDAATLTRRHLGQFVPFTNSDLSTTTEITVLDGNSYKRTVPAQKHRVIRVENGGVVDGCLIRNGHVRNKNGGGVLLNGGKLYNSIVRGNVAMSHPDSAEALGGGVFIQAGGELINCLVAYNMANDGYGVAAGTGGGRMINNTITANTYSPVFAKILGTPSEQKFTMYQGNTSLNNRPGTISKLTAQIELSDFYISRTLTTEGQYAVFCAAMDIPKSGADGRLNIDTLASLQEPIYNSKKINAHYNVPTGTGIQRKLTVMQDEIHSGLDYANGIWYPHLDTSSVEYPVGNVTWYGSLAYSVWLGGGLPTEAQWEYAARLNKDGTVSDNFYSGAYGTTDSKDTITWRILDTIAWVANSKSIDTTPSHNLGISGASRAHEVARKRPNAMGIYDMTGNIGEYLADCWNGSATGDIYSSGKNPINNTAAATTRVWRGGSWANSDRFIYFLAYRAGSDPTGATTLIGFRPVASFD